MQCWLNPNLDFDDDTADDGDDGGAAAAAFDSGVHWDRSMMVVSPTRPDAPYQKWRRTTIYRYLQHVQKLLYIWNRRVGLQLKNHTIPIGPMLFLWRSRYRQPATSSLYMLVGSTRDVCNGRWEFTIKQLVSTHFITNQQSLTGHWSTFNFGRWRLDVVPLFKIFILIKNAPLCGHKTPAPTPQWIKYGRPILKKTHNFWNSHKYMNVGTYGRHPLPKHAAHFLLQSGCAPKLDLKA